MDFIEKIFGFSPDGGSGSLELVLLLIPIASIYLLYRARRGKASSSGIRLAMPGAP